MRVCVIGAGAAGLAAARHVQEEGYSCTIYEMNSSIGGVWVYTDDTHLDQYGYPVHSAMYKGLMTNLPKEIMGFPDFSIEGYTKSYLTQEEILTFLFEYAKHFDLEHLIKFNHVVKEVYPLDGGKWRVTVENKENRKCSDHIFDSVMICSGHYSAPFIPDIPGKDTFAGKQYHSKHYRQPDPYTDMNVLVVGAGPSGKDLALHLARKSKTVYFSHNNEKLTARYPDNVIMKPLTTRIVEEGAEFADGTKCAIDVIIYCTGYLYDFPFLHESCGIHIDENYIQPLYKHIIHIEKPTMCFIGIPFNVCAFQMFDLQTRFYVSYLKGKMKLPAPDEMKRITREELEEKLSRGFPLSHAHLLGPYQRTYYSDLATLADTHDIPQVMINIKKSSNERFAEDLLNFRKDVYQIVDSENFIHVY